ncbi:MAG: cytochrome C [Bacteroidetes bacterium]|nr:MAG: cytochrome C [Bacteroidota bacterium]
MKKLKKILGIGIVTLIILLIIIMFYVKIILPDVGDSPELKVNLSEKNIERGKYLANHVMLCVDCHSTRDWSLFSGPIVEGTTGKGGETFDQTLGFPGKFIAPNITPYHLKNWTDGEIFRAITSGVSKDGRALFSIMPYHNYGMLDKKDIEAVIAYIRTWKPIENKTETSAPDFPMNFIINTLPQKPAFTKIPEQTDKIKYGKYMATAAGCIDCHTKQEQGKFVGKPYAGGFEFKLRDGSIVRSANITPHEETGIGSWSAEQFVRRFKIYADSSYQHIPVSEGSFQTVMPWTMYAGMKEKDLEAIFYYLQSLPPVNNSVEKFTSKDLLMKD